MMCTIKQRISKRNPRQKWIKSDIRESLKNGYKMYVLKRLTTVQPKWY